MFKFVSCCVLMFNRTKLNASLLDCFIYLTLWLYLKDTFATKKCIKHTLLPVDFSFFYGSCFIVQFQEYVCKQRKKNAFQKYLSNSHLQSRIQLFFSKYKYVTIIFKLVNMMKKRRIFGKLAASTFFVFLLYMFYSTLSRTRLPQRYKPFRKYLCIVL